jgi:hypothetical protein
MTLTEKIQALSPREKGLMAALSAAVMVAVASYVYPLLNSPQPVSTQAGPPVPQAKAASPVALPSAKTLTVTEVKDPFQVPPQYQVKKEVKQASDSGPANQAPASPVPLLNGIMSSGGTKTAILDLAGNSDTVGIGGSIGAYTVDSITDTQVVLTGPEGRRVLNIGR